MAMDMKKLQNFANTDDKKKGPLPKGMKGYGKGGKSPHQPIVGRDENGGDGDNDADDIDVDSIAAEIENGGGNKKLLKLVEGYDPEDGPPSFAVDQDVWDEAVKAVDPENSDYENPYQVVAAVYERMGGEISGGKGFPPKKGEGKGGDKNHKPKDEDEEEDEEEDDDEEEDED